jgi:two-component system, OmpR family, alkaline phosphatase synthesis response regulator PhoP
MVAGMTVTVLVVDDEPHIAEVLRAYLLRDGYDVRTSGDGNHALALARSEAPDVLILDVMLPGMSGFDLLRTLRAEGSRAAVIMLTARDDLVDRVAGLELGADDYVVKPFEPREVVARVGAMVRRIERLGGLPSPASGQVALLDLRLDLGSREARRSGHAIALTRTEFDLLAALAEQPGRVWTREQLGQRIFGEAFEAYDRTIDSHVKNVRRKLGAADGTPGYVETVRGVGYRAARPAS